MIDNHYHEDFDYRAGLQSKRPELDRHEWNEFNHMERDQVNKDRFSGGKGNIRQQISNSPGIEVILDKV